MTKNNKYFVGCESNMKHVWTLLATQVARVRFPVPARPTFRVEKVSLFFNPASGGTFSSTEIEIIKWFNNFAVAQAKVSHILRPGSTAFKEQLKLVNGFKREYRRIHALKKKHVWNDADSNNQ
jgi:hypothetical protein